MAITVYRNDEELGSMALAVGSDFATKFTNFKLFSNDLQTEWRISSVYMNGYLQIAPILNQNGNEMVSLSPFVPGQSLVIRSKFSDLAKTVQGRKFTIKVFFFFNTLSFLPPTNRTLLIT